MNHQIIKTVVRLLLPFILLYAFYIQWHGEISPGGGFQSGVIFASAFIVYSLVYDIESIKKILSVTMLQFISVIGVLIYACTGLATIILGGNFLSYNYLADNAISGQKLGIMLVEAGVGLTVFSVIMLIFYSFGDRPDASNR